MSETTKDENKKKSNKIAIILSLVLAILLFVGIMYFANKNVQNTINKFLLKTPLIGEQIRSKPTDKEVEAQKEKVANYYLDLSKERALDKLLLLKNEDSKIYSEILRKMRSFDYNKTTKLEEEIREYELARDFLQREVDAIEKENEENISQDAKYYSKLSLSQTINRMRDEIKLKGLDKIGGEGEEEISFYLDTLEDDDIEYLDKFKKTLDDMKIDRVAQILYYLNQDDNSLNEVSNLNNFYLILMDGFGKEKRLEIEKAINDYKNELFALNQKSYLYSNMEAQKATTMLENQENFKLEELVFIFQDMPYYKAGEILAGFKENEYKNEILNLIADYENIKTNRPMNKNRIDIIAAINYFEDYNKNLLDLVSIYQKMSAQEIGKVLEEVIDSAILENNESVYKKSQEEQMLDVLRRLKPKFVSEILNTMQLEMKTELSKKIGLPIDTQL